MLVVSKTVLFQEQQDLLTVIMNGRVNQVNIFIRRGGAKHLDFNMRVRHGEHRGLTPLHCAVLRNDDGIVASLVEHNARPDVKAAAGVASGALPLHLAARVGALDNRERVVRLRRRRRVGEQAAW